MIFDKLYEGGKSAVRLTVAAGAVALAGGLLILAPQWSLDHIGSWGSAVIGWVKAAGSWLADLVHSITT